MSLFTTDRQISERMALDAKKREQFQKLKEQFAKDQEVFLCVFLKPGCISKQIIEMIS